MSPTSPASALRLSRCVCAGCGCLCDDIAMDAESGQLKRIERACPPGVDWLRGLGPLEPTALVKGRPASVADAISTMAESLAKASSPMIVGLTDFTVDALRAVTALSDTSGAILAPWPDPPQALALSGLHAPECSATLGEVRATADLVVFWRADPVRTHPRHLERYSFDPPVRGGRRVMLIVDVDRKNETARQADESISLGSPSASFAEDVETVRILRLSMKHDEKVDAAERRAAHKAAPRLEERLRASRHAHFFLGDEASRSPALWDELQSFAASLREKHRITISALPAPGNARGVLEVLTWRLGPQNPALRAGPLLTCGATDLVCAFGLPAGALLKPPFAGLTSPRICVGRDLDPLAVASIRVPGIDPRLSADIVRSDGIHLSLDGRDGGIPDPAVEILGRLIAATNARGPSPSPQPSRASSASS